MKFNDVDIDIPEFDETKEDAAPLGESDNLSTLLSAKADALSGEAGALLASYYSMLEVSTTTHNGKALKKNGSELLYLFDTVSGAIEAGVLVQQKVDAYNLEKEAEQELLVVNILIGSNAFYTANGYLPTASVDDSQVAGSAVSSGEVLIFDELYQVVKNTGRFTLRLERELELSDDDKTLKLYKVLLDEHEIGAEKFRLAGGPVVPEGEKPKSRLRIIVAVIAVPLLLVIAVTIVSWYKRNPTSMYKEHSITHTVGDAPIIK